MSGGILILGDEPEQLTVIVKPRTAFTATARLKETPDGPDIPWPDGTTARLEFTSGRFQLSSPVVVEGAFLHFALARADTEAIPAGATARLFMVYPPYPEDLQFSGTVVRRG